jgi:hypothetical protein
LYRLYILIANLRLFSNGIFITIQKIQNQSVKSKMEQGANSNEQRANKNERGAN